MNRISLSLHLGIAPDYFLKGAVPTTGVDRKQPPAFVSPLLRASMR